MTWVINERSCRITENRSGTGTERDFDVYDSSGAQHTIEEARGAFSDQYNFMTRDMYGNFPSDFSLEEVADSAGKCFLAKLRFAPMDKDDKMLSEKTQWYMESFDTSGGQAHVAQGYNERRLEYSRDDIGMLPDFGGGIGWDGQAFAGCDIASSNYAFSAKTRIKYDDYNIRIADSLVETTGCVNKGAFCGIHEHGCLFKGAQGSIVFVPDGETDTDEDTGELVTHVVPYFEVTCNFVCAPRCELETEVGTIEKRGFDYAWILYAMTDDQEAQTTKKLPVGLYVTSVYREADFGWLGVSIF